MFTRNVLITGANRGIGLEFVKQFIKNDLAPDHVIATCRNPKGATELNELVKEHDNLHLLRLDISELDSFPGIVDEVMSIVGESGLSMLINNAGIVRRQMGLENLYAEDVMEQFKLNAVAPLMLTKEFAPLLRKAASSAAPDAPISSERASIINITSKMGSIADSSGGRYGYRLSKCSMNMMSYCLAKDLRADGIMVLCLHPGWVMTEMGGPNAIHTLEQSVTGMFKVMKNATEKESGGMFDFKGNVIPY